MPNRILKESICTSKELAEISLGAETLFYRLIVKADDFGCYHADSEIVRNTCYAKKKAVKESNVKKWLEELQQNNLIEIYTYDGQPYLHLLTFDEHQQRRATKPKFPLPSDDNSCKQVIANAPIFENVFDNENVNENERDTSDKPPQISFGEFQHVKMTQSQYDTLCKKYGQKLVDDKIASLDAHRQNKERKYMQYKDHYATIGNWCRIDAGKQQPRAAPTKNNAESLKYMQRKQTDEELNGIFVDLTKEPDE